MSAVVITTAAIKGGCAKTTTAAVTAWMLSERGYKVLAVDGDPQGNLTEIFFMKPVRELRYEGCGGILQAIKENNPKKYIQALTEHLDLLIGEETFGTFPDYLYKNCSGENIGFVIKNTIIDPVKDDYDFIIIDTAPTLNTTLSSFMIASDYVLGLFETNKFCYSALYTLFDTVYLIKDSKVNEKLDFIGILISQIDTRRSDNKEFLKIIRASEDFGPYCFLSVITRKASTGRLSCVGFFENPELNQAIAQFEPYIEEVLERVEAKAAKH